MYSMICDERPMTVRQVFYRMVSEGLIEKKESEYKNVVCRLLSKMRREEVIPYHWIADNTRWMRKPNTHSSLSLLLEDSAKTYRRAVWDDQDVYVEIWLEKEALAGVVYDITEQWDVPLMVTRGYPSLSYLHSAAESIIVEDKPTYLYYFGDYDPSGMDIARSVREGIDALAIGMDVMFERVAVTPKQIEEWGLPTRPTKGSDTRSKGFKGDSVELDAIPSADLRALVSECIVGHVDKDALDRTLNIEKLERESLDGFAKQLAEAG